MGKKCGISIGYKNLWRWSTNYLVFQWLRPPCRAWNWVNYKVAILQIEAQIQSQKKFSWSQILVNLLGKKCGISFGPHHAKRARMTWHLISSNLHWKSSAKNGSSNWVLIQGVIFTVSIIISGLLSLPSCYLENEALRQKSLKLKMDKICCPGPFRMTQPICKMNYLWVYALHTFFSGRTEKVKAAYETVSVVISILMMWKFYSYSFNLVLFFFNQTDFNKQRDGNEDCPGVHRGRVTF